KASAEHNATETAAVNGILSEILTSIDPNRMGGNVTMLEAIQDMVRRLDNGSLKGQPLVEASVRETIGNTLLTLSREQEAEANLLRAYDLRLKAPASQRDIAESLNDLGVRRRGQRKFTEAEELHLQALAIREKLTP